MPPIPSQQVAIQQQQQQPLSSSPILPQSGPLYLPSSSNTVSVPVQSQNSPFYSSSPISSTNCLLDLDSIETSIDWKVTCKLPLVENQLQGPLARRHLHHCPFLIHSFIFITPLSSCLIYSRLLQAWDDYLSTEEFDCKQELPSPGIDLSAPMKDLELGDSAIHSAKDEYDTNAENFSVTRKKANQVEFSCFFQYHEVKASPFVITGSQFKPVGNLAHILQQTTQALLTQEAAQSGPLTLEKENESVKKLTISKVRDSKIA